MKICLISLLVAAVWVGSLFGEGSKVPPLPEGPLIKRMPDSSAWNVMVAKGGSSGESAAAPAEPVEAQQPSLEQRPAVTSSSKVVKSGPTIWEVSIDGKGKRTETWHYRGLRILKLSDALQPFIFTGGIAANDIYTVDFKVSDFAGLNWIAPDRYVGVAKFRGRDCIVFEGRVSPLDARTKQMEEVGNAALREIGLSPHPKIEVAASAYIDLESRLPLFVKLGDEKRTYQYDPSPSSPLQLPPDLASAVKEYAQRIQRLSAPPGRAY